jgi:hypothetical protein
MKKILITLCAFLLISTIAQAQDHSSGVYFGAILGTKYNSFNRHFALDISPDLYSFSIGAGSAYTKNNYVFGTEFLYSTAQKDNSVGTMQYIGFSNTFFFGYNVARSNSWRIEPTVGLVLDRNQLLVQDKAGTFSQNLTNNPVSGNVALNIKLISANGLFTGLKMGYIFPFASDTEWQNKLTENGSGLRDNVSSFYLQLNIGGLLRL